MATKTKEKPANKGRHTLQISLKFERDFLERIDRQAVQLGTTRTGFITTAVGEKLVSLEKR